VTGSRSDVDRSTGCTSTAAPPLDQRCEDHPGNFATRIRPHTSRKVRADHEVLDATRTGDALNAQRSPGVRRARSIFRCSRSLWRCDILVSKHHRPTGTPPLRILAFQSRIARRLLGSSSSILGRSVPHCARESAHTAQDATPSASPSAPEPPQRRARCADRNCTSQQPLARRRCGDTPIADACGRDTCDAATVKKSDGKRRDPSWHDDPNNHAGSSEQLTDHKQTRPNEPRDRASGSSPDPAASRRRIGRRLCERRRCFEHERDPEM